MSSQINNIKSYRKGLAGGGYLGIGCEQLRMGKNLCGVAPVGQMEVEGISAFHTGMSITTKFY